MTDPTAADDSQNAPQPPPGGGRRRRSGSQKRKKLNMVTSGYDDIELAALEDAASKAGKTRASYQREQTLGTVPRTRSTRRPPIERETLARLLGQLGKVNGHLGRIGSNLNQLAQRANWLAKASNTDSDAEDDLRAALGEVMGTVADVRELLPLFMEAFGRGS